MQINVPIVTTPFLATATPAAGTTISVASVLILLFLGAAIVLLFMKLQALGEQVVKLRREVGRFTSGTTPARGLAASTSSTPSDPLADAKLVAVLTAAAVAYLGKRVAVRRITFINQNTVSGWAEAGRLSIHTSHNVRRN